MAFSHFIGTRRPERSGWRSISGTQSFCTSNRLPAGLGSNDIGLDRGQLGDSQIVRFERVGPRVLLVAPNYDFRAITNNSDERTR